MADAVFSTGELKMADAIYRQEKWKWQMLFFDRRTENGRCYFSTGELKMADAIFRQENWKWQMLYFDRRTENGRCYFSTGELKMADAIFRQEKWKWQMLFFDRRTDNGRCYISTGEMKMADAVFRHEDCSYIADRAQYLQYLRVFPFTYKSKTKFNRSANNVKFKNKLYVKFKVLRVWNLWTPACRLWILTVYPLFSVTVMWCLPSWVLLLAVVCTCTGRRWHCASSISLVLLATSDISSFYEYVALVFRVRILCLKTRCPDRGFSIP